MIVNKSNYEKFALDYIEGKLSAEHQLAFTTFLSQNPEIAEEVEGLKEDMPFLETGFDTGNINLHKGTTMDESLALLEKTFRLEPPTVEFSASKKQKLKRTKRIIWMRPLAWAASLALLISIGSQIFLNTDPVYKSLENRLDLPTKAAPFSPSFPDAPQQSEPAQRTIIGKKKESITVQVLFPSPEKLALRKPQHINSSTEMKYILAERQIPSPSPDQVTQSLWDFAVNQPENLPKLAGAFAKKWLHDKKIFRSNQAQSTIQVGGLKIKRS